MDYTEMQKVALDVPLRHKRHRRIGWATKAELREEINTCKRSARFYLRLVEAYEATQKAMGEAKRVQQALDGKTVEKIFRKVYRP